MQAYIFRIALVAMLLGQSVLQAQDFLLQGCYASCQDSMGSSSWMKQLQEQAPDLAYRGFTYIRLPKIASSEKEAFTALIKSLRKAGIRPMMDLNILAGDATFQLMPLSVQLHNNFQIKSYRIFSNETPKPVAIANFLNEYHQQNPDPALVYADIPTLQQPDKVMQWINDIIKNLPDETRQNILPRVYDYPLREALRRACFDPTFDVREIFTNSLRDASALIGYNIITGVNKEHFMNANEVPDDADDMIEDPLLAYAYLLTNNQIGLPEIFYADYYGKESGNKFHVNKQPLKKEIDQLLKVHRDYIVNSTDITYLNRIDTDKKSIYQSALDGADAAQALIFQLDGTNTSAGKASNKRRDVLVAINFADVTLKVIHEINSSKVRVGDVFTDILSRSAEPFTIVQDHSDLNIPNAVYLEVPPRSYSIWVHGEAMPVTAESISLAVETFEDFIELTWETPMEMEIKNYEVEKAINGSPFRKIATLSPLGEAGADYLYTDEECLPEDQVAYRIKTIFKNGKTSYSSIQELKPLVKGLSFELLENARPSVKTIKFRSNQLIEGKVTVFNAAGKSVMAFNQAIKIGVSLAQIDLASLPKGIYLLNIEAKDKVWTKKIVNR